MKLAGLKPNEATYASLFGVCAECGRIEYARNMFDTLPERNVVLWNAMITGYRQNKHGSEVLGLLYQMQRAGIKVDHVSFLCVLGACADLLDVSYGEQIHSNIIKSGFGSNVFVCYALMDMYMKCGRICDARQLFQKLHAQNLVSYTTMIAGYAHNGYAENSLILFSQMQLNSIKPDVTTFTGLVNACASLASLENGEQVHAHILKAGFEKSVFVRSSIVDMYSKCGNIQGAWQVFEEMPENNVILWNAMIASHAHHGYGLRALQLFEKMQHKSIKPDSTTFIAVLSACSHAGLVDEGRFYFEFMSQGHCIEPRVDHYMHMVDLLGRRGLFYEVEDLINRMPFKPDATVWGALVGACKIHGNLELGARAALHLIELEPNTAVPYVLLSSIYAAGGRWEDVEKVRKLLKDRGIKKQPGCSWIVIKTKVNVFVT
ncbi:pentatricopeptide repeat-containing protein At2g13600-like [Cryptomeria japonica]|uniref:pentatricopeptide repeat-containing protein At2g13600-like n=1 Tax=Cryptomeria japonica TaxID=3369 RepID=UPI0027DA13BE|nr:pentatricopeptide repeat-containing protein At2g13600-like [Cryptomeria japonica]